MAGREVYPDEHQRYREARSSTQPRINLRGFSLIMKTLIGNMDGRARSIYR